MEKNIKIIATQKFVRMSPRKLRLLADSIRGLDLNDMADVLPMSGKRAGEPILKVIKTAMANAKSRGFSEKDLEIEEIQIGDGPVLKRGRAVSRGRWHPYIKRMSHIRVVLTVKEKKEKGKKVLSSTLPKASKIKKTKKEKKVDKKKVKALKKKKK